MSGQFIVTVGDSSQLPDVLKDGFLKGQRQPRMAMVGRSNVGKSSLINAILDAKLAQVSNQPGKTRCIHLYLWKEGDKIIADLPGYGYAKTAQTERNRWAKFINAYLDQDEGLEQAVVLLDARHGPTELDEEAIRFLSLQDIPVTFVFTKADTLKTQSERVKRKREVAEAITKLGYDPESVFWVSARSGKGLVELKAGLKL